MDWSKIYPSIPKVLLSLQLQNPHVPTSPVLLVDARNITGLSLRLRPTCATVTAVPVMASAMAVTLGRGKEGLEGVCPPWLINVGLAEGASIMAARAGKLCSMVGSTCLDSPWRMEKPFGNKGNIWSNQPVGHSRHSPHSQQLCNSHHQPRLHTAASKQQSTYRANGPWIPWCQQHVPSGVGWSCLVPTGPGLWMMWA